MGLFSSSKDSYLGVDIGTASIKVVELKRESGKPFLVTYGYIDISSDIIRSNTPETRQRIITGLKKVLKSADVTTDRAIAALPTFSVFNSIITLPKMPAKDLNSAIKWEAKKYVPLPLEEMILDFKVLNEKEEIEATSSQEQESKGKFHLLGNKTAKFGSEQSRTNRVLVTAAPKNLVSRYIEIFKQTGLKLISLETEAFALARSMVGYNEAPSMIVDIGSITTDTCVIEKGVAILNRSVDIGGLSITQAIANSLNISVERAEQFKRDFGVSINQDVNQKGIPKLIISALTPVINEIKYVFDLYHNQGTMEIEKIILSGGSAFLPNLTDYFSNFFNKPTIIGNPWDKIIYPLELKPVLDEIGSRLAVAIGLAMRDI
ncbi:pilus assembly protein PilM [Patescibacteria group bacterium]|nr:pilus assembly protein PilM [Patescibacteria group bacterium]